MYIGGERTPGVINRAGGVEPTGLPGKKERFLKRSIVRPTEEVSGREEGRDGEVEGEVSTTEESEIVGTCREYSRRSCLSYANHEEDEDDSSNGESEEDETLAGAQGGIEGVFGGIGGGMTQEELRENGWVSSEASEEDHTSSEEDQEEGEGSIREECQDGEESGFSSQEEEEEEVQLRGPLESSHPHPHSHAYLVPPHQQTQLPASPLKLFQSTYDTYTRNQLDEIVDLVDSETTPEEEESREEDDGSEEGFLGDEGRVRSSKRIRLSPPSVVGSRENTARYVEGEPEGEGSWEDGESRRSREQDEETPIKANQSGWNTNSEARRRRRRSSSVTNTRSRRRSARRSLTTTTAASPLMDRRFVVEAQSPAQVEAQEDRKERVRDRKTEAVELMEKIRKRSEERENRRKGLKSSEESQVRCSLTLSLPPGVTDRESKIAQATSLESTLPASPRKISISSARSPLPLTPSLNLNASPPPLPHLAAAATASLRSVLGSPAPSPRIPSSTHTQQTVGLGFSREFPSSIVKGLEKGGTITGGKRVFSTASPSLKPQEGEPTRPSPFLDSVHQATPGHKRRTSLTTIHPSSVDAQRLLASVVGSKDGKGMQFDSEMGRWIRTPNRKRIVSQSTTQGIVVEEREEDEEEEEDPFKDFSELQSPPQSQSESQHSSRPPTINEPQSRNSLVVPPLLSPSIPSPVSTLSRADLDNLPLPGDGSGSLKLHHFDLSGLGISKGTPPLLAPPRKEPKELEKSPEGACYFDSQPHEEVPEVGETPLLRLEEEEEDSATWGEEREGNESPEKSRPSPLRTHSEPATPSHIQQTQSAPPSTSTPFPRSALKPSRAQTDPTGFTSTLASTSTPIRTGSEPKLPRSVSFSDGKRQGKIRGLESWEKGSRLRYEVGKASLTGAVGLDGQGGAFGELEMDESVADAEEDWEANEEEEERRDELESGTSFRSDLSVLKHTD